ncbi:MAG: hypothetical protein V3U76_05470 [Granulosicoccus sp.]
MYFLSFRGLLFSALLLGLSACSSNDNSNDGDNSQVNQNTGEPGGDVVEIAGLWNGTVTTDGKTDVLYWFITNNGVLILYDYDQDDFGSVEKANCYVIGAPVSIAPDSGDNYLIGNIPARVTRAGDTLTITFQEADTIDIDRDGDVEETVELNWSVAEGLAVQDLNACS